MKLLSSGNFFDPLFDDFFAPVFPESRRQTQNVMRTDIKDNEDNYLFEIELAGVDKNDISVDYDNGYLSVAVSENEEKKEERKKGGYIIRERKSMNMSRTFYVGEIDEDKIKAEFKDGVLTLNVPKQEPEKVETKKKILIG